MPRKAETKAMTKKKSAARTRTTKKTNAASSPEDHEKSAYLNWLNRGAPLWDDQRDWFETTLH